MTARKSNFGTPQNVFDFSHGGDNSTGLNLRTIQTFRLAIRSLKTTMNTLPCQSGTTSSPDAWHCSAYLNTFTTKPTGGW